MNAQEVIAYIGIGSNLGNREELLKDAVLALHHKRHLRVDCCSSIYETDPVGFEAQPAFLNMVVRIRTTLEPERLLEQCLAIEQELGRVRMQRWGPRTIDLDVLLYNYQPFTSPMLDLPHPRMHERLFVLIPLLEIVPATEMSSVRELQRALESLEGKEGVRLWRKPTWPLE